MWKRLWSNEALKKGMSTLVVVRGRPPSWSQGRLGTPKSCLFSSSSSSDDRNRNNRSKPELGAGGHNMSFSEVKKLTRLVNVEALKRKLGTEQGEVISYIELLDACEEMGLARCRDEAGTLARALDEAGVVLLFRDKVYLHPNKVAEVVRRAVPLVLSGEDDVSRREELEVLQKKKDEIDVMAHKQVRRILWGVLGLGVVQVGLFFRLTFWEFSWDVMEPITFFTTSTGILMGYAYFLFTARDPSYQDLMQRLFVARQRNLFKLRNFDAQRFKELQNMCSSAMNANPPSITPQFGSS